MPKNLRQEEFALRIRPYLVIAFRVSEQPGIFDTALQQILDEVAASRPPGKAGSVFEQFVGLLIQRIGRRIGSPNNRRQGADELRVVGFFNDLR